MVAACKGWRNAVDLHHLPGGTHSLASRPGPLVRLTFQNWCWRSGRRTCDLTHQPAYRLTGTASARFRFRPNGARGRTCTCTIEDLSFAPLHWATRAMRLVPTAGFAPTLRAF